MMGSVNASDQDAKVLQGYNSLRGMEECRLTVELLDDVIELGMRGKQFRWSVLQSEVWFAK
jgi:hypothetical protein